VPPEIMLPAVGQGAVAVEIRSHDEQTARVVERLDDKATRLSITAERSLLRRLEGGCQVPIGALATLKGDVLTLEGMVGSLDGRIVYRKAIDGPSGEAEALGNRLADSLIEMGARELLEATREQVAVTL